MGKKKGTDSKNKMSPSDKTVTGPTGVTRVRGAKAGKARQHLPFGHPERTHREIQKEHD